MENEHPGTKPEMLVGMFDRAIKNGISAKGDTTLKEYVKYNCSGEEGETLGFNEFVEKYLT